MSSGSDKYGKATSAAILDMKALLRHADCWAPMHGSRRLDRAANMCGRECFKSIRATARYYAKPPIALAGVVKLLLHSFSLLRS